MQSGFAGNKFCGLFATLAVLAGLGRVSAASVSLAWSPSSDPDVAGYNIYYGPASGNYTNKISVGTVATVTIPGLDCGATYYFSATAFGSNGAESAFSNETQFIVPGMLALSQGLKSGDPMLIKFPVAPSHWYEVQASVDLRSWAPIWQTAVATTNQWVQYSDPQAGAFPSRFYRLVMH